MCLLVNPVVCQDMDVSPAIGCPYPDYVFGSDADVSPVIGFRAPRLPSCVRFGSDADVSPVIGIQAPSLPVFVFACLACVSRTTAALILVPDEIRRHRMRCPIELSSS